MNHAFSKIWIIVILAVFITGGILAWQYWWKTRYLVRPIEQNTELATNKEEKKFVDPQKVNLETLSPADLSILMDLFLDFNGDGQQEIAILAYKPFEEFPEWEAYFVYIFSYDFSSEKWREVFKSKEMVGGQVIMSKESLTGDGREQLFIKHRGLGTARPLDWFLVTDKFQPIEYDWREVSKKIKFEESFTYTYGRVAEVTVADDNLIKEVHQFFREGDFNCCPTGKTHSLYFRLEDDELIFVKEEITEGWKPPG